MQRSDSILFVLFVTCCLQVVFCQTDPSKTQNCVSGPSAWYRGTHNVTKDGIPCQRWDVNEPHTIRSRPKGDFHHNYCRNPDMDLTGLWCYTTDNNTRWQVCGLPKCHDDSLLLYTSRNFAGASWISHYPADAEVGFIQRNTHRTVYNATTTSFIWTIAADKRGERVFFTDYRNNRLGVLSMATNKTTFHMQGMCNGIEEMAYDWEAKILYWTDSDKKWVMASDLKFKSFIKIYKNDSEEPFGIALHAVKRKLYFFTYMDDHSSIKMANMDGSDVTNIFTEPTITDVPSMAVDYTDDRLYWINNKSPRTYIMSCNLDGGNLTVVYSKLIGRFWGIAAYMDTVFLADQIGYYDNIKGRFYRLWILSKDGIPRNSYKFPFKTKSLSIYSTNEEYSPSFLEGSPNGCLPTNPCQQLCIPLADADYACGCTSGYTKNDDNQCVLKLYDDNFMVIGDLAQKKLFQIPFEDEAFSYSALPIPAEFDDSVTTIALDSKRKVLYWSDLNTTTIYSSDLRGSDAKPFLGGKHARAMVVDPATGNVYFADDDSSFIYVVDSKGKYPKVLHKPTDDAVENNYIEDLALDCDNKYIYWTARDVSNGVFDLNGIGMVMRMGLDGSDKQVVFHNIITPRAIDVNNEKSSIFLASNGNIVYEIPLSELDSINGNLPAKKKRYLVDRFSREDPLINLVVLGDHGFAIGRSGNAIIKFDLTDDVYEQNFGSTDFFRPQFLAFYNSTYQARFANHASQCATMQCSHLCLQRPGQPPVCQCGDSYKFSRSSTNRCIHISADDSPPSYGKTCPRDIEISYMFCQPEISLPPWDPPTWTDDKTATSELKITSPTIKSTYKSGTYTFTYTAMDEAENVAYCSFTVTIFRTLCQLQVPKPGEITISRPECKNGDIVHAIRCKNRAHWVRHGPWLNKTAWNLCLPTLKWQIEDYSELSCEHPPTVKPPVVTTTTVPTEKSKESGSSTTQPDVTEPTKGETPKDKPTTKDDVTTDKPNKKPSGNETKLVSGSVSKPVAASSGLAGGTIAAIVVAILLVVIIFAVLVMFAMKRKAVHGGSLNPLSMVWNKTSDLGLSSSPQQPYENF